MRKAAEQNLFDLRVQRGVRIGMLISDDLNNGLSNDLAGSPAIPVLAGLHHRYVRI
jgi:hypothetical protein